MEQMRVRKGNLERQLSAQEESIKDLNENYKDSQDQLQKISKEISKLKERKEELHSELSQSEKQAFKNFCKKAKVKSIQEYEQTRLYQDPSKRGSRLDSNLAQINTKELPQTEAGLVQHKVDLESALSKFNADFKFNQ